MELVSTTGVEPCSLFDEALFDHFLVAEPQIGNVRGAETQNVFESAAHFAEPEIDSNPFEQLDELLRAFRKHRPRMRASPQGSDRSLIV